jgi:HEAT repeat protein
MNDHSVNRYLLDFVVNGFVFIPGDASEVHQRIFEKIQILEPTTLTSHIDDLLPRIDELAEILQNPSLVAALSQILGANYLRFPHHCLHSNFVGIPGRDPWHQDRYGGGQSKLREHLPNWVIVFYLPQAVTEDMGPTALIPGSQYLSRFPEHATGGQQLATGSAGSFFIIHYDLWHRRTAMLRSLPRYVIKFEFVRRNNPLTTQPVEFDPPFDSSSLPCGTGSAIWHGVWSWATASDLVEPHPARLKLKTTAMDELQSSEIEVRARGANQLCRQRCGDLTSKELNALASALCDESELVGTTAAYAIASHKEPGAEHLIRALSEHADFVSRRAAYGLSVLQGPIADLLEPQLRNGRAIVRQLACFVLGNHPHSLFVEDLLIRATQDDTPSVRATAIESLGKQPFPTSRRIEVLERASTDSDIDVRWNAEIAMLRIGNRQIPS